MQNGTCTIQDPINGMRVLRAAYLLLEFAG